MDMFVTKLSFNPHQIPCLSFLSVLIIHVPSRGAPWPGGPNPRPVDLILQPYLKYRLYVSKLSFPLSINTLEKSKNN